MTVTSSHDTTTPRTPNIAKGVLLRAATISFAVSLILGVTGLWQQVMPVAADPHHLLLRRAPHVLGHAP